MVKQLTVEEAKKRDEEAEEAAQEYLSIPPIEEVLNTPPNKERILDASEVQKASPTEHDGGDMIDFVEDPPRLVEPKSDIFATSPEDMGKTELPPRPEYKRRPSPDRRPSTVSAISSSLGLLR